MLPTPSADLVFDRVYPSQLQTRNKITRKVPSPCPRTVLAEAQSLCHRPCTPTRPACQRSVTITTVDAKAYHFVTVACPDTRYRHGLYTQPLWLPRHVIRSHVFPLRVHIPPPRCETKRYIIYMAAKGDIFLNGVMTPGLSTCIIHPGGGESLYAITPMKGSPPTWLRIDGTNCPTAES